MLVSIYLSIKLLSIPSQNTKMWYTVYQRNLPSFMIIQVFYSIEDVGYDPQNMTLHILIVWGYKHLRQTCCFQHVDMCGSGRSTAFPEGISKHSSPLMGTADATSNCKDIYSPVNSDVQLLFSQTSCCKKCFQTVYHTMSTNFSSSVKKHYF